MQKTILVVDDSEYMRGVISSFLDLEDFKYLQAKDGVEALTVFNANSFDLIITDINMPRMNGITLIKEIRKLNATIPIIVLTTESAESMQKEALLQGANGWLTKPFNAPNLMELIEGLMD